MHVRWCYCWCLPVLMATATAAVGFDRTAEAPTATAKETGRDGESAGPLILEEPAEPLRPARARTEAELDRIEALSLFAAGRMLEKRGEQKEALRLYQRAFRRDPQAATVARAIIPLAFRLKRHAEAVRYALEAVEIEDSDPLLLRRLGVYLTETGDFAGAVRLYERAIAARPEGAKDTAADVLLRMEMGRLYHLLDDYAKAADSFARVLAALERPEEFGLEEKIQKILLGDAGPTYNLFGECFLESNRPDEARAAFEKAHQLSPNQGLLHFNLARIHAKEGQPQPALEALEACFREKLATEGTDPWQLLAQVLAELGREKDLVGRLEKLHRDDPKNIPLAYYLAQQYREAKRIDEAEKLYRELLKQAPTLTGYRALVAIYREANDAEKLLTVAGEAMGKTNALDTLNDEAEKIIADAELVEAILDAARKRLQADADSLGYGPRLFAAMLALNRKQFDAAAEFFDLAVLADAEQTAELLLIWGVGLLVAEEPAAAAKVFQRAIDAKVLPEGNPAFVYYLAGALAMAEKTDEALAAARQAAAEKPDSARFASRAAWVLYHARRHDEALRAYRELIEKFDDDHGSAETRDVLREARLILSSLYVTQGNYPQAEEWLEQVLDEFPDEVGASNDLGYLWADQNKRLGKALKMIQRAVAAEPDNRAYRDSLGWIYYRLERYAEAVVELERAAAAGDDDEPDPVILDHLGDAYLKTQQKNKALDAWRKAVEGFQKEKKADEAKAVQEKIREHD